MYNSKIIKNLFFASFLSIVLFGITSCKNKSEPCKETEEGPTYTLSTEAKSYFDNYSDASRTIFVSSTGEETTFNLSEISETNGTYGFGKTCEEDNSLSQYVTGQTQSSKLLLSSSEFVKPLLLQLVEYPETDDRPAYEVFEIYYGTLESIEEGSGLFAYGINGGNLYAVVSENLELNGTVYDEVIGVEDPFATPKFEIMITKDEGIVYIKDNETAVEYFYDRKE